MIAWILVFILAGVLYWKLKAEKYQSEPFDYPKLGDVGYIGPDPKDDRIVAIKKQLIALGKKGVDFVRIESIKIRGNHHICNMIFLDNSTKPYAYKVTARLNMKTDPIVVETFYVHGAPVDLTNGMLANKHFKDTGAADEVNIAIIKAVTRKLKEKTGSCLHHVTTSSLTVADKIYQGRFIFVNLTDFPVGMAVSAIIDATSPKFPVVTVIDYEPSNQKMGISPKSESGHEYVKYATIQKATAEELKHLKTL